MLFHRRGLLWLGSAVRYTITRWRSFFFILWKPVYTKNTEPPIIPSPSIHKAGLSLPFLGMGPGPLALGKLGAFRLKLGE